ncbi:MAG: lysostaphin resistance A-like protein [Promethearchaeota archaeon]
MGLELASSTLEFVLVSLFELLFLLVSLIFFLVRKRSPKKEFKKILSPEKRQISVQIADIFLGIGVGLFFYFLGKLILKLNIQGIILIFGEDFYLTGVGGTVNVTPPNKTLLDLILSISVSFLLVGFCEEFFFRGFLFKEFSMKSKKIGGLTSSLIFSIYHVFPGIVPIQTTVTFFLYYLIMGILFVILLYYRKGQILSAIIAHGTFNSLGFIFTFLGWI